MTFTLLGLAAVDGGERGTRLYGAIEAAFEVSRILMPPIIKESYDHTVESLRASLGESAFAEAWKQGRAMTLDEAVDYALLDPPSECDAEGSP